MSRKRIRNNIAEMSGPLTLLAVLCLAMGFPLPCFLVLITLFFIIE